MAEKEVFNSDTRYFIDEWLDYFLSEGMGEGFLYILSLIKDNVCILNKSRSNLLSVHNSARKRL